MGGGKSKAVTVGYRYYMGLHFGICYGPVDALKEIRCGERTAWTGEQTASGTITIDSPTLFGGEEREGGVSGTAAVMMGAKTQGLNPYLQGILGPLIPAYRGILSLVLNKGYIGANNPYIKPWAFLVRRILAGWDDDESGSTLTEYGALTVRPWKEDGTRDPRSCENEHQYRFYEPEYSEYVGPWRGTLEEAKADGEAFWGRPLTTLIGWFPVIAGAYTYPHKPTVTTKAAGQSSLAATYVTMRFTDETPSSYRVYADDNTGSTCNSLGLTIDGPMIWWNGYQLDGTFLEPGSVWRKIPSTDPTPAGWIHNSTCTGDGPSVHIIRKEDMLIQVQRIPRGPDDPCSPSCTDPYPADPNDPTNFCLIDSVSTARGPYSAITQTHKELRTYEQVSPGYARASVGPLLLPSDPNYNNAAFWDAAYAAALSAGEVPAGWTQPLNYPKTSTTLYSRTVPGAEAEHDPWYPETIQIGADMNPAHIIYQCITNKIWGMGYPEQSIDDAVFRVAADTLYAEEFGLSLLWNQQGEIGQFIGIVLDHIGGVFYADPFTGKFGLKLIRGDYDPDDLEVVQPVKGLDLESWQRVGYGDTTNEVTVIYTDGTTWKETGVTVQDLANIQAQGAVVSETVHYPGITKADLAGRVAMRDCTVKSTALAKGRLKANRNLWSKVPGDVFKLTWPKLGLNGVIVRVLGVNYGTLTDGSITVEIAEDFFGLPDSSYVEQEPAGWEEPDTGPENITLEDLLEAPYWDLARNLSTADLEALDDDSAYVMTLGARENGLQLSYNVHSRVGAADYAQAGAGGFSPTAVLSADIDQQATTLSFEDDVDISAVEVGERCLLGSGRDAEWCEVTAISTFYGTITVSRGVLDTVQHEWPAGTRIWFPDSGSGFDPTERATGEEVDVKLTSVAPGGEIAVALANEISIEPDQRFARPYPPGNVEVNGEAWPTSLEDELTVTWAHRDRTQQTVDLVAQDEGDIGPEPGTTYNTYLYDDDTDELLDNATGISGTSWATIVNGAFRARLEIESERDGIVSWQRQVRTFDYEGTLARITEDSVARKLEGSASRLLE